MNEYKTLQENQSLNAEYERHKRETKMVNEIERLNKELEKYKYSADELNEIERLSNIIKEVREYIEKHSSEPKTCVYGIPKFKVFNGDVEELLEILDKGE